MRNPPRRFNPEHEACAAELDDTREVTAEVLRDITRDYVEMEDERFRRAAETLVELSRGQPSAAGVDSEGYGDDRPRWALHAGEVRDSTLQSAAPHHGDAWQEDAVPSPQWTRPGARAHDNETVGAVDALADDMDHGRRRGSRESASGASSVTDGVLPAKEGFVPVGGVPPGGVAASARLEQHLGDRVRRVVDDAVLQRMTTHALPGLMQLADVAVAMMARSHDDFIRCQTFLSWLMRGFSEPETHRLADLWVLTQPLVVVERHERPFVAFLTEAGIATETRKHQGRAWIVVRAHALLPTSFGLPAGISGTAAAATGNSSWTSGGGADRTAPPQDAELDGAMRWFAHVISALKDKACRVLLSTAHGGGSPRDSNPVTPGASASRRRSRSNRESVESLGRGGHAADARTADTNRGKGLRYSSSLVAAAEKDSYPNRAELAALDVKVSRLLQLVEDLGGSRKE